MVTDIFVVLRFAGGGNLLSDGFGDLGRRLDDRFLLHIGRKRRGPSAGNDAKFGKFESAEIPSLLGTVHPQTDPFAGFDTELANVCLINAGEKSNVDLRREHPIRKDTQFDRTRRFHFPPTAALLFITLGRNARRFFAEDPFYDLAPMSQMARSWLEERQKISCVVIILFST